MKLFLLAAAAVIAMPATAQMQPGTQSGTSTPDSATPATPADAANPPGTTTQDAMPAQSSETMPNRPAGDPVGGYQPAGSPMTGTMTPGVSPVFRAAPSPSEAYPAPAPLASYPVCRPGQFDKCMNGTRSTHSRQVRARRR